MEVSEFIKTLQTEWLKVRKKERESVAEVMSYFCTLVSRVDCTLTWNE